MLKNLIKAFFLRNNIFLSGITPLESLENFFYSLKPINVSQGLIRIGGNNDGGYLVPDDLSGVEICFSPGVCATADFENDLVKRGVKCFLADYSVHAPPVESPLFDFEKKHLGTIINHKFMTLEDWVNRKAPDKKDFIMQMDIEGAEYSVISQCPDEILSRFRILVIEFHGLGALLNKEGFELINLTFSKLIKKFDIVHIHPNNCCGVIRYKNLQIPPVMEFTFLRRDRVLHGTPACNFPHPYDRPNVPSKPDIHLPNCWFK